MKKILYIMHIDWDFIKQRPQFIAESLSANYQITVYKAISLKAILKKGAFSTQMIKPNIFLKGVLMPSFSKMPFMEKWGLKDMITGILLWIIANPNRYDCIYIGNRNSYKPIRFIINRVTPLLYDCMDDENEFPEAQTALLRHNQKVEKQLLERANYITCTSDYLKSKLQQRVPAGKHISVVRNAIGLPNQEYSIQVPQQFSIIEKLDNIILYIGAVAEWFDFETLLYCLDQKTHFNIVLVGPILGNVSLPKHPRIHTLGPCQHQDIYALMSKADILTMPFIVNELIKSVNPVKLYEYIYSGKPIIASRYGETERFEDFVYLYSTKEEFYQIVSDIEETGFKNKQSKEDAIKYAQLNTWDNRAEQIKHIIDQK